MNIYRESEYQKELAEIFEDYNKQMKPLKNPFLRVLVVINAIIGTCLFLSFVFRLNLFQFLYLADNRSFYAVAAVCYPFTGAYFIRYLQVIHHRSRRLIDLEDKKTEAVSLGFFDANS